MEAITLDPPAVATGRTELDLLSQAITATADGIDWGDAAIEQALADGVSGSEALGFRIPNRTITIPLRVQAAAGVTFAQARNRLQQKVALLQREGGYLKRQPKDTPLYADIVNATLKLSGNWLQAHQDIDHEATLTLECLPDFYGAEIDLGTGVSWGTIKGNYPARCRIELTNGGSNNWKTMLYALRNRFYTGGSYDQMSYNASSLTPLDAATQTTVTGGASNPSTIQHASLADDWTPVAGTNVSGNYMNHAGTYRVFARLRSPSAAGTVRARFGWDVGDLINPTFNDPVTIPVSGSWVLMDLGEVILDKAPAGTHRWGGQVQGYGEGLTLQVDQLFFFNTDEYQGIAQGGVNASTFSSFAIRDPFNQSAGALSGKNLLTPSAQTWATSGATGDFAVETTGKTAQRTQTGDASAVQSGRIAVAGSANFNDMTAQVDVKWSANPTGTTYGAYGIMVKYNDANNWIAVVFMPNLGNFAVIGKVGGSNLGVFPYPEGNVAYTDPNFLFSPWLQLATYWYRLKVDVSATTGVLRAWWGLKGFDLPDDPNITFQHAALITGGALGTYKPGIYDGHAGAGAVTRNYDNFWVKAPTPDAAVYPSRVLQLTTKGMFRQDSAGGAYGRLVREYGDLPRLPVSGLEGRTTELIVRPTTGDLASEADNSVEQPTFRTYYRPCYLFVPED